MVAAVLASGLSKVYAGRTTALDGVSLEIPAGRVFGLIGRNGAGKTTFVRIAATPLMPTSGQVSVLGLDILTQVDEVRLRIASVPQESRPLYFVTVDELIYTYLRVRGAERADARRRTAAALEEFSLTAVRTRQVNRLSGGTRRRAMVAMILACDAEVLFLDEPTTGLDPLARREVWSAIRRAQHEGRTVILTTHYLDEAEALSSRIALLDGGKVKLEGSPEDLRGRVRRPFRVTVHGAMTRSELESFGEVSEIEGGFLVFAREMDARDLAAKAMVRGARVSLAPVTLEDIFLQVVGTRLDDETTTEAEA
ncbi:MAG: ABC transporter ATP-binding protein [Thermoplasmata archaeon]|nr:ABC transporter ATP-binding protein [Thermoplasmata archaeon]